MPPTDISMLETAGVEYHLRPRAANQRYTHAPNHGTVELKFPRHVAAHCCPASLADVSLVFAAF